MYGISFLALLGIIIFGCQKEKDQLSSLKEMKTTSSNDFFEKVVNMNLQIDEEHVIYIRCEWNKENDMISIKSAKEKEPDFFILESTKLQRSSADYKVECSNGDQSWEEDCDGKWSCGGLIADCLDEGGCATICQAQIVFAPQINAFYIGNIK